MNSKSNRKATVDYIVDVVIAVGFVLAAVSGFVLLFMGPAGFQGGRNPHAMREVLSLSRWTWKAIHDWGATALIAGVLLHMGLHWRWIVCMTRNLFSGRKRRSANATPSLASHCKSLEA